MCVPMPWSDRDLINSTLTRLLKKKEKKMVQLSFDNFQILSNYTLYCGTFAMRKDYGNYGSIAHFRWWTKKIKVKCIYTG